MGLYDLLQGQQTKLKKDFSFEDPNINNIDGLGY